MVDTTTQPRPVVSARGLILLTETVDPFDYDPLSMTFCRGWDLPVEDLTNPNINTPSFAFRFMGYNE